MSSWEVAVAYHQATKHHYHRFAQSLGYLDWDSQPDPFRRFDPVSAACPESLVRLSLRTTDSSPPYGDLYAPDRIAARTVDAASISEFFELSLALSAWKEFQGSRWALRVNPSSGNLHPTEGYLVAGAVDGLFDAPGVHHYAAREHGLQRRCAFVHDVWQRLAAGFPADTFLVGLASIHWREAWKYGERSYRYCQHDLGHAMGACALAAQALGWCATWLRDLSDADVSRLLGLDRVGDFPEAETEAPGFVLAIAPGPGPVPRALTADAIEAIDLIGAARWQGRANRLSPDHVDWPAIDAVADACVKPRTEDARPPLPARGAPVESRDAPVVTGSARQIIRQRRSTVAFDAQTGLERAPFYAMLRRVMPFAGSWPWQTLGAPVATHLALFVHRVHDLAPGLYCLARSAGAVGALQQAMHERFVWQEPEACPDDLPLFLLENKDVRALASQVSCQQDIAGDGAFSLGMIVAFNDTLREGGAWTYRRLFWETGLIGQVLYLEAEAAGIRATGIGCFFDDPVHEVFGLNGTQFQSLYHFTMGGPVDDTRLTTLPAYP